MSIRPKPPFVRRPTLTQLHLCTWDEVRVYLTGSRGVIVPIGSTEQHGPNGLVGTDSICAEAIARGAGEAAAAMVGPVISVGMAQHHMAFPGSITLRPSTLMSVIQDYVFSLAHHGFERFLFVNGHGGNRATIQAAFDEIHARSSLDPTGRVPRLRLALVNWFETPEVGRLSRELYGARLGAHATPSEVAVTQYLHPDAIKSVPMEPVAFAPRKFADALDFRALHPDGRMGSDPSLATPEHGRRLHDCSVAEIAALFRKFQAEP